MQKTSGRIQTILLSTASRPSYFGAPSLPTTGEHTPFHLNEQEEGFAGMSRNAAERHLAPSRQQDVRKGAHNRKQAHSMED